MDSGPGRWNPLGPVDSVAMDTKHPFVGDHTPVVTLAGNEPRGIRQTGVKVAKGVTYNGRIQLAGKSVAVPFVGTAAATLVVAEAIMILHGGPAITDIKLVLSALTGRFAGTTGNYGVHDLAGLNYGDARVSW